MTAKISNQTIIDTADTGTLNNDMIAQQIGKYHALSREYQAKLCYGFCIYYQLSDSNFADMLLLQKTWTFDQYTDFREAVQHYHDRTQYPQP